MKRYRSFYFFALAISFLNPFNMAYLYYDHYSEIDLEIRKHFSTQDKETLLTLLKKNPRILYYAELSIQNHMIFALEVSFFQSYSFLPQDSMNPVLRC